MTPARTPALALARTCAGARLSRRALPAVVALALGASLAGCSDDGTPASAASSGAGGTSTPAAATASATASAPEGPGTTKPGPTTSAPATSSGTGGSGGGKLTTVPSKSRTTLPPAPPTAAVQLGEGLTARLAGQRRVTVTGRGPGELSGPAVALTLELTNGSKASVPLGNVTVTAAGAGEEASPSDSAPARPVSGSLAPGARTSGVYVFVLPQGRSVPLRVTVSATPTRPLAVFTVGS
jgi:hypothetical protein